MLCLPRISLKVCDDIVEALSVTIPIESLFISCLSIIHVSVSVKYQIHKNRKPKKKKKARFANSLKTKKKKKMHFQIGHYSKQRQRFQVQVDVMTLIVFIPFLIFVGVVFGWNTKISRLYSSGPADQILSTLQNVQGLIANLMETNNTIPVDNRAKRSETRLRWVSDLPPCAAQGRARTFMMLFQGHSGTTALMTSLRQHSETFINGLEPIDHAPYINATTGRIIGNGSAEALKFTEQFFANTTRHGLTAGFKARPNHILNLRKEFAELVKRYSTRIIWSYRANVLKQSIGDYRIHNYQDLVSYEGLRVDKMGVVTEPSSRAKSFRINDTDELLRLIKRRAMSDHVLSSAVSEIANDGCVLPISYESYLKDPDITLERIQRFLGLNASERHAAQRAKANGDSLCELVENFDEVCEAFFVCAELRWMLDDVENGCSCSGITSLALNSSSRDCSIYQT